MSDSFASEVFRIRQGHEAIFPSRRAAHRFVDDLMELLFPQLSAESVYFAAEEIDGRLAVLARDLKKLLIPRQHRMDGAVDDVTARFFAALPAIYRTLWLDAGAIHEGDPASASVDEVVAAYPGFFAICVYRLAHELYRAGAPILPRLLAEYAHVRTGVDIHPGAKIGERFCIDHGTGVVVGETTVIGSNVKLYQGVSLGALSVAKQMARTKRHPTVEDNVVIYSNATILGGKTIIGNDSVIGGNVWLTDSVPPFSIVYHTSEIKVRSRKTDPGPIDFSI